MVDKTLALNDDIKQMPEVISDQLPIVKPYHTAVRIDADSNNDLPSRVMLMKTGSWINSNKGDLAITTDNLHKYVENFKSGKGVPGNGKTGLPIDFSHEDHKKAAAWIKDLEVAPSDDPEEASKGVMALYGNPVEWTASGKAAVSGGDYKCISPSFFPAGRGGWPNPENNDERVDDVIVGAGLTNIPFFNGLSPVKASQSQEGDDYDNMIYINKSVSAKETESMKLEQVLAKSKDELSSDESQFLADHKAELSAEQQEKFGLVEASSSAVNGTTVSEEDAKLLADIKAGNIKTVKAGEAIVEADRLAKLEASATEYQTEKAKAVVVAHITRGAIKSDQEEFWTSKLLASKTADERAGLEAALTAIPSNETIAAELGSDSAGVANESPRDQLAAIAASKVEEGIKNGTPIQYGEALKAAMRENRDLSTADGQDTKVKAGL